MGDMIILKAVLREAGCECVDWMQLVQDFYEHDNELSVKPG
jgi:hypothetical protein